MSNAGGPSVLPAPCRQAGHRALLPLPAAPQFVARFRSNRRVRLTPASAVVHASRIPPSEARRVRSLAGSRHRPPPLHRIRSGTPCCAYVEKMLVAETASLLDHRKDREARIRKQLHKVELPPSPYDTAWVAMVPLRGSPRTPCFPQCVEWILQNQHENGSWDNNDLGSSANKNVLLSTLACVLALEKWNLGQEHIRRGLHFIGRHFSLVMDEEIAAPTGFNMIFPGMLSLAVGAGLQFPVRQTDIDWILQQWEMELKRSVDGKTLAGEKSYGREAYMAYVSEGLGNLLDWNEVMKFQRKNGSLFNSPSTTAAALVHNYDDKALDYLNMVVSKFGGAVPTVYPLNMHWKLSMVDSLEKIGISRHFSSEIEGILDMAYSFWLQRDEEIMMDVATCAMAFRLLRMNGYDVSSDELSHLAEASNFHNSLQGYLNDTKSVLELYKASKVSVAEHELILDNIGNWSGSLLSEKLCSEGVQGLPNLEVEYAVKFPFYTTLERLDHKRNIEHFDARGSHILKTECLPYGINQELLALAVDDFTFSQSIYQDELLHLDRWVKENRLDQLQFARQKLTYCYLSAAATIFPPELSDARISWAKNGVLTTVVDDFFDVGGSKEELENLIALVEKWDEHHKDDFCSEQVRIVFCALYTTVNQLGSIASAVQNRDVKNHLIEIWLLLLRSMMTEAEWQRSQYVPTMEEYMTNGVVSFALGPIVLPTLYCVGEKLLGSAVKNQEYSELFRLMSTCGRLLNDSQGFEREGSEGKLNSVSLLVLHSGGSMSIEAAKNAIEKSIVASRRDLLRLVLKEGTVVPRACKELFWKMCKILHLFYFRTDGFSSPKEMASAVNAVINEPLRLSS
ncbi:ent-kaur-16-ene synthase, chloroplastic-like isoform X2 [Triticum urartu]|uniref:ent-kaur-16-ene synthase, chloroplastic-like isoform X2 n=1 Tax=Triticum urartu TaxID=4572 RepID=UPI0020445AAD|nr:ent-kaur-16-ene synthase, chloroplastic-like isoform X2 [Triticum urartu]XP_048558943.1 ent-kaur-16-ene synthase, chloroplastic-like isoform X2 [Triticum urartu]